MDKDQLAAIEQQMQEEHKKDLEALARLKRFIPSSGASGNGNGHDNSTRNVVYVGPQINLGTPIELEAGAGLKPTIRDIMNSDPAVRWTNPKMLSHLKKIGFDLKAKRPIYSIGQATNRLHESGEIKMLRKGAGNTPNVYCGLTAEEQRQREMASENKD